MRWLLYQGPSNDTTFVNDLGYYGCYPDRSMKTGMPLSTRKTISLQKRKSMNSSDLLLGSALAIELCLGSVLLYYLLKCINALRGKEENHINNKTRSREQTPSHQNTSASPSDDAGYLSAPAAVLSSGGNRSSFRQRQELELQQLPVSRNNGDQDDQLAEDKDK